MEFPYERVCVSEWGICKECAEYVQCGQPKLNTLNAEAERDLNWKGGG